MSDWAARRFWEKVSVRESEAGFAVFLDERPLRTPAKAELLAPTAAMADHIAEEWRAQGETVDPGSMPFTKSLNACIDKVARDPGPVANMIAGYAETDLLCYRATGPAELVARQAATWDPYLNWAEATFDARLSITQGVMPVEQPHTAVENLARAVHALDPFEMTAAHDLVTLSGSLILGLAALKGQMDGETLVRAARLDELWQIEQWGEDEEAEAMAQGKKAAILHALAFEAAARGTA